MARLCGAYWYPLYAYVRRSGHSVEDAQDLTQSFLATLLEKRSIQRDVQPGKGRFRSFLIASLKHFLLNSLDRAQALKRGGGQPILSLDWEDAERAYSLDPAHFETPEAIFERNWALSVLRRVQVRLQHDFARKGKLPEWELYQPLLVGENANAYRTIAENLGRTEEAVKSAIYRLRRNYGRLLRQELAETVLPQDLDDEIQHLLRVLSR